MAMVSKDLVTETFIRVNTKKADSMVKESIFGQMGHHTKAIL